MKLIDRAGWYPSFRVGPHMGDCRVSCFAAEELYATCLVPMSLDWSW